MVVCKKRTNRLSILSLVSLICILNTSSAFLENSPKRGVTHSKNAAQDGTFDNNATGNFLKVVHIRKHWKQAISQDNVTVATFSSHGPWSDIRPLDTILKNKIGMHVTGSGKPIHHRISFIENIIEREQWRHCHIIVKEDAIGTIQSRLHIDGCIVIYLDIQKVDTYLTGLSQRVIKMETIRQQRDVMNFVVIADADQIINVMKKVEEMDIVYGVSSLFRHFSRWLLVPIDGPVSLQTKLDNVAVVDGNNKEQPQMNVAKMLPSILRRHRLCLELDLPSCQEDFTQMIERFTKVKVATVSTLLWRERRRAWNHVATAFNDGEIKWDSELFPNEKYGLNGRKLVFTMKEWKPFSIKQHTTNGISYDGICPRIIKGLSEKFNFTYSYIEPSDGQWGQLNGDKWTGLVGDVQNKFADMTGVVMGKDYHRSKDVDFSQYLYVSPFSIVYRRQTEDYPLTYLVRQFKKEVYICGFAVFVAVNVLFAVIDFTHMRKESSGLTQSFCCKRTGRLSLMLIASALHQGVTKTTSTRAGRILLAFWWLYTLIITVIYCGNLIAYQAVSTDVKPFKSLSEMLERSDFVFGFEGRGLFENSLKLSDDKELNILWKRICKTMETDPTVTDPEPAIHYKRLLRGNYAFVVDRLSLDKFQGGDCRIVNLDTEFLQTLYSFVFPKNSPVSKLFNGQLLKYVESGMIERLTKQWKKTKPCEETKSTAKPMKVQNYLGVIIASAVLTGAASLVLLLEVLCSAKYKHLRDEKG